MMALASPGRSLFSFALPMGILILIVAWVILRLTGVLRFQDEPKRDKASSAQSRRAEAVMLLCGSLVIWIFTATNTSTGGRLFLLEQLHSAFARVNVIVAALSLLGILCSCLIAARWSSSLGVVLCTGVLILYPSMLNGPREWLESFVPQEARAPRTILHFDLVTCDLQDAEFYVNGVSLGTLPVTVDQADFLGRVPVWMEPPARLDRSDIPAGLIEYKSPNSSSRRAHSLYQTIRFKSSDGGETAYYAQVKHRGKWCYATGSGGSGGGGGRYVHQRFYGLNFLSPDHEQRLERLLDWARIRDYNVPDGWFKAMETYGRQGIMTLLQKTASEPGMGMLLDQWASMKFALDAVQDEDTAWQAFERVCQDATRAQAYSTEGLEGRAVARLAPRLSIKKLAARAKSQLRNTGCLSWSQWQVNGTPHFGISRGTGRHVITGRRMSYASGGRGESLSIPGYAVAHALWVLFEQGNHAARAILQDQIMPCFIAHFHRGFPRYRFVCSVGGAALERFLLRQDWEADPAQLPWEQQANLSGEDVNGWFHMLAYLDTPVGREFRQTHRDRVFQMADLIDLDRASEGVDFLFLDLDQGKDSLAYQYWPRFLRKTPDNDRRGNQAMKHAVEYLVQMGEVSEPGMYVEVFKAIEEWTFYTMESFEVLSSLASSHRARVCEALREAMEGDISHLGLSEQSAEEARARMLMALETVLASDEEKAEQLYQTLTAQRSRHYTDKWLQQLAEDHAIVPRLATSDQAGLRRMALYAIESFPSAAHRALLDQLLQDSDPQVGTAATAVKNNLDELANMSLETMKVQ